MTVRDTLGIARRVLDIEYCEELSNRLWKRRMAWIRDQAHALPNGTKVLDVGAGTTPYRDDFAHTEYVTQDLAQTPDVAYGTIDIVSDVTSIPLPDESVDAILCTEVFEHIPYPLDALREISRLLRPGGQLIFSAPLGSGQHQKPYHFYGGYTRWWYEKFFPENGLEIESLEPNGGLFGHLAEMLWRTRPYVITPRLQGNWAQRFAAGALQVLAYNLPTIMLWRLEERTVVEDFTACFFCLARKSTA